MNQLSEESSKTLQQVLNQAPNFFAYAPRSKMVAEEEEPLLSLLDRLLAAQDSGGSWDRLELTADEQHAVVLVAP